MTNITSADITTAPTQAEKNLSFVTELFEAGEISDRFSEIDNADWDATAEDLCHIVFDDGTAISINPGSGTVKIDWATCDDD